MARVNVGALSLLFLVAACGPVMNRRDGFGSRALDREHFPVLDTVVAANLGRSVVLYAQQDLGQLGPVRNRENTGFARFDGRLFPGEPGWVTLIGTRGDTIRVGKGHVTGIWRRRAGAGSTAFVAGGAFVGVAMAAVLFFEQPADRPSQGTQMIMLSGATVVGGVLGAVLFGGARRGAPLYPPVDHPHD